MKFGKGEITLIYAGGIRNGGDVAKAVALGADAVAIGHAALMALNCKYFFLVYSAPQGVRCRKTKESIYRD